MASSQPSSHSYFPQLDGVRCLAVLLVLVDHWLAERNTLPLGPLGVNLFFVLSGFLISRILMQSKLQDQARNRSHWFSFKQFYIRRSLRIFPVYYLSVLVLWVLQSPSVLGKMPWHLLYATNLYIAIKGTWLGVTDHFWSLAVEEQFYLFFPLLIFLVPVRYFVPLFVGLGVFSIGLRVVLFATQQEWMVQYVSMPTCLDAFGVGAGLAYWFEFRPEVAKRFFAKSVYFWLSLGLLVATMAYGKTFDSIRNLSTEVLERSVGSVFAFFMIGKAVIGWNGLAKWLLENPVSSYLGRVSYGLYVYHNFVYNYYHTPPDHPTLRALRRIAQYFAPLETSVGWQLLFFFGLTLGLATVSWYLLEKPINGLKRHFSYT